MFFAAFAAFAHSQAVFQLSDQVFEALMGKADLSIPWFVMFGGNNCPACTLAVPEFSKASEGAHGFAKFGFANVDQCPGIVKTLEIKTIPSFYLFMEDGQFKYSGSHTAKGMLSFVSAKLGEGIEEIDESWSYSNDSMVLLFHRSFKPPMIMSAAYGAFKNKNITFGISRDSDVIEAFGNPLLPSYWFYKDGVGTQYLGTKDFASFIDAIAEHFDTDIDGDEL
jgi:hypothetical protein